MTLDQLIEQFFLDNPDATAREYRDWLVNQMEYPGEE